MTLDNFLPFLLGASLLGCAGLLAFLVGRVTSKKHFLGASLALALALALNLFYGVANHYTGVGINEAALFQIGKGIDGLTRDLLMPLFFLLGMVLVGFGGLLVLAWLRMRKRPAPAHRHQNRVLMAALALAILFSPGFLQPANLAKATWNQDQYRAELQAFSVETKAESSRVPKRIKKVVTIYAEGLERAFLEEKRFPGLMPNLNRLRPSAVDVRGVLQVPFTGWTIAGQVATQCGVGVGNGQNGEGLGGTTCLGDLFQHQGFTLSYLNASHLSFAGKGDFWKAHGYDRLVGYQGISELAGQPQAPKSEWGPYDDTLFKAAQNEYQRLEKVGQPFVLTLLTVDTHANKGYPTPACAKIPHPYQGKPEGNSELLKAVHCSDRLIGAFIETLLAQKDPELLIILVSDHVQPKSNDAMAFLPRNADRENLFLMWGSERPAGEVNRKASPFDVYPTLADAAGLSVTRAGLGRSLLQPAPTAVEHFGSQAFFDRIQSAYTLSADGFWEVAKPKTSPPPSSSRHGSRETH